MNDMTPAITPKSDQISADDLISGPITIIIERVEISPGVEQPVNIFIAGGDRPWRPCKSMSKVLVYAWGADAKKYTGRSVTLFRDPTVKWGGLEVGGIRISHMSHLDAPMTRALTQTRGNKKAFTVQPLKIEKAPTKDSAIPYTEERESYVIDQLSLSPTLEKLTSEWKEYWPEIKMWAEEPRARATAAKDARKLVLAPVKDGGNRC